MGDLARRVPLSEFASLQRGHDLPERQRRDGAVPILGSFGITGWHDTAKSSGPGLTIGRSGASIGVATYVDGPFWPLNTTLYVTDFHGNDPRFVYYVLDSIDFQSYNSGSAQPSLNRNYVSGIPVWCPPVEHQRKVASILSAFDDLIENNARRIQILEEIARAIYREWFVEFRYPGYESVPLAEARLGPIPAGWDRRPLFDVAEPTFGFPFKADLFNASEGVPVIRIRDLPKNSTETYTTESAGLQYMVEDGDLLVGMDGDFHMCKWAAGAAYLNQRVVRFRPHKDVLSRYEIFLALERPIRELNDSIIGTTVAHLGKRHLEPLQLVVPPADVRIASREIFDPLFDLVIQLRKATVNLRSSRDLLLLRLISGELDVSDLDIDTGELVA